MAVAKGQGAKLNDTGGSPLTPRQHLVVLAKGTIGGNNMVPQWLINGRIEMSDDNDYVNICVFIPAVVICFNEYFHP